MKGTAGSVNFDTYPSQCLVFFRNTMCFCHRRNTCIGILVFFVILYLCLGALIFAHIEGPHERQIRDDLLRMKARFISTHYCMSEWQLNDYMHTMLHASEQGVIITHSNTTSYPNWNFGKSFFFAGTILTTMGYGHVTPLSFWGRSFCTGCTKKC